MLVTKKHKGITITIINPEAIPVVEEKIKKMIVEMALKEMEKGVYNERTANL